MADALSYKCPKCGAPLEFSGGEMVTCEYCDAHFTVEELDAIYAKQEAEAKTKEPHWEMAGEDWDAGAAGGEWQSGEAENLQSFTCSSCGAEIVADANTMATECCYCGNPTMIPQRFSGMLRPDFVIPFKKTKEEAVAALTEFSKGKRLLPNAFLRDKRFEKIQGMYVPFWLFSAETTCEGTFDCTKSRTFSTGNDDITEISHYRCVRTADAEFQNVPADGSEKMNDTYMEAVEPFDYGEMVPFSMAYMAGFLADKYDVDAAASMPRADARIHATMIDTLSKELRSEYETATEEESRIEKKGGSVKYALAPVWILSTKYNDKIYTFMMNGQTGKFIGTLPSDEGKQRKYMAMAFAAILAVNYLLSGVHYYLPFVFLAIFVLIFGFGKKKYSSFIKEAKERGDNV